MDQNNAQIIPQRTYVVCTASAPGSDVDLRVTATTGFTGDSSGAVYARRLYIGGAGDVAARKVGDAAVVIYKAVPAGTYMDGAWIVVGSSGHGTSATQINAEQ